jgi:hypothetical protein
MEKTSMALWGDTKGRFAFTPNALHGASPYIDRLQVDISIPVTQPLDPGRLIGDSVRLSFWLGVGGQGPLSGALA